MPQVLTIETHGDFSFEHTVKSHGWSDLLPFRLRQDGTSLAYTFDLNGKVVDATISGAKDRLDVEFSRRVGDIEKAERAIKHIFRLDEDLSEFYKTIPPGHDLAWAARLRAGRLLRTPTVFEDLVKTMCTTNCSWGSTKSMVANLVNELGPKGAGGRNAFPTAAAMAAVDESFFREKIKAGYRAPYFVELANKVVEGVVDPEAWLHSPLSTPELRKEIKSIKGIGDYAADNLLKLLGRYDGLALDSWLRARFYEKRNKKKPCPDKKIEKYYSSFGDWKGLAIWCDMTEDWFGQIPSPNKNTN